MGDLFLFQGCALCVSSASLRMKLPMYKEENRIGLRIMYTDSSVQWVILTPSRNTCKTRLATSFDEESIDEAAARLKYGRQPSTASGSDTWQRWTNSVG